MCTFLQGSNIGIGCSGWDYYLGILTGALGPRALFFFSELQIQISAGQFWQRSRGMMAIAPPPAVGSPRPWYCKNALDPARRAMSYSPLTEFFLPLNDHPPPAGRRSDSPPLEAILPPFSSPIVEMPRSDEWERKLLRDLAGTVRIEPGERRLLANAAKWKRQGPRETDNDYEFRLYDNWPPWLYEAYELEEAILRILSARKGARRYLASLPLCTYVSHGLGL